MDARTALLHGLVDYAGLFPPANLELTVAMEKFDAHLRGPDAARLGRFVLPVARLGELAPWLGTFWHAERPLRLSLLASPEDLAVVAVFMDGYRGARVEALELRMPSGTDPAAWLDRLVTGLVRNGLTGLEVYVELNPGTDTAQLAACSDLQGSHPLRRLGAKLRCGGVRAEQVPSVTRVASVIATACVGAVPLKFTAGLHHPVRGMDQTEDVPMHGFLNVYGAALLAPEHGLDVAALEAVVTDSDPRSFRVDETAFAWCDQTVAAARIAELRRTLLGGFGSCSFAEPMADLRSLSLLPGS